MAGEGIDLRGSPVEWRQPTGQKEQDQLSACFGVKAKREHSLVALRKWRSECYSLARNLNGRYRAMETVECDDLLVWSERIDSSYGVQRVQQVLEVADLCIAGLPATVKQIGDRLTEGSHPKPRRKDYQRVVQAAERIAESAHLDAILEAMNAVAEVNAKLVFARLELWREMKRTLQEHRRSPSESLRQTAWNLRNRLRPIGSRGEP